MRHRAGTILGGRRDRLERILGRELPTPAAAEGLDGDRRAYLLDEAQDLYWNELEWEHITDEEAVEGGPLTELAFPGLLAYVRGLLLQEVMPDALAPAQPRPAVVEDLLDFLAKRVVELEEGSDDADERSRSELEMTSRLIDLVLYEFHGLSPADVELVEADGAPAA